ncbi:MAG: aryl-sulfate sulfotransferase [Phycisphaerales bacterium]|nr:aryl-sulfate sulfotransferase [Phycisphaerales bacterium]
MGFLSSSFNFSLGVMAIFTISSFSAAENTIGIIQSCDPADACSDGYKLFAPLNGTQTYLIDGDGMMINSWVEDYKAGNSVYLLENGTLLRCSDNGPVDGGPAAGGDGGCASIFDWDNNLLWRYCHNTLEHRLHHDIEPMPNGNILMISWEVKSNEEALAQGRDPAFITDDDGEVWPLWIIEVEPDLNTSDQGTIVWEWRAWDHLVQDFDSTKPNYGVVADNPNKINLNYGRDGRADWMHCNGIDYNEDLDQIIISTPFLNEIFIIDHGLTTEEAATEAGDLLYRWGNPMAYDRGTEDDRELWFPHDVRWVPAGYPGAGNITVFNNGNGRPVGYSRADEIVPPLLADGSYDLAQGAAYGPNEASIIYEAPNQTDFYSSGLSGVERTPEGTTLICMGRGSGTDPVGGQFFEVNAAGEVIWRYINPVTPAGPLRQGDVASGQNAFRCSHYPSNYAGFAEQDLTPQGPLELCRGDVNRDSAVDVNDLLEMLENFGSAGPDGDLDLDGDVDVDDLLVVIAQFGGC